MPTALAVGALIAGGLVYAVGQRNVGDKDNARAVVTTDAGPTAAADVSPAAVARPRSVGTPINGTLVNARPLPTSGRGFEVLTAHRGRGLGYGTAELVDLVAEIGAALAAKDRTLLVGNLSAPEGGPIRHSRSHQSGRDVDLAFCYKDKAGEPQLPPDFVLLDNKAQAAHLGLALDAACTWEIVEAAMRFKPVSVQHVFVSAAVERRLIDHARAAKAPKSTIDAAMRLLSQPRGTEGHDDHMHVRIACPPDSDECSDRTQFKGGNRFHEPTE